MAGDKQSLAAAIAARWYAASRDRVHGYSLVVAILHQATLNPSKLEVLSSHLATSPYFAEAAASGLTALGAYRFDDPAGAVGIETHLLTTASVPLIQIPLTYREAPLAGAEAWLVGTMEHSVLGPRWVYNACGDPIFAAVLLHTILSGGTQAGLFVETDEGPREREPAVRVAGSGTPDAEVVEVDAVVANDDGPHTRIQAAGLEIVVRHVLDEPVAADASATLSGTWPGVDEPVVLAFIR